jgi:putative tryptophan/tyrosine transport system substrate-binding protein
MLDVRRREFFALLGGAAAWPLAARGQLPGMQVIGFLHSASLDSFRDRVAAFHQGLKAAGFVEGGNLAVEYRWAEGRYDRLPALAGDLVARRVAVLVAMGPPAALAAKAATATIPIVFANGSDPVKLGLVASLNRPGGNVTGVSFFSNQLEAKKLAFIHELVPGASVVAVLVNPTNPNTEVQAKDMQAAGSALGLKVHILQASSERDIDTAVATMVREHAGAFALAADAFLASRREQLAVLALRHALPSITSSREEVAAGSLMSYGTSIASAYREAGGYVGRILKGDKPADLPVVQSTRFELVINLKTAKALGLTLPQTLLVAADEVIE